MQTMDKNKSHSTITDVTASLNVTWIEEREVGHIRMLRMKWWW